MPTRRKFITTTSLGLMGTAFASAALDGEAQQAPLQAAQQAVPPTPGAPPVLGAAAPVGPAVTPETFAQAEKLVQIHNTSQDLAQAASNWQQSMAPLYERRVGPRKLRLEPTLQPATVFNPLLTEPHIVPKAAFLSGKAPRRVDMPTTPEAIAFAPVSRLSAWLRSGKLSSVALTQIYIERIKKFDPQLRCVITLCEEQALKQARQADDEMSRNIYRGPLHGIPWGAKDLLDTAGIRTTYGAEFFRDRVPTTDATVVKRLREAGAVLVAKLSLGALALNDVWFGGQTMNPWLLDEGASGSSSGPAAAVAAGLVGFAIGSETQGSIVSPSMRCGVTGLRPTFGRVPRTGAMTLSWSCDKLGVMSRGVEDTMLVLDAIYGSDEHDVSCMDVPFNFDAATSEKLTKSGRIGYFPQWMKEAPTTDVDRAALATIQRLGFPTVPLELPDWPYDSLNIILFAEAAASFEELTLSHAVDQLRMQTADAWPNTFRQARFLSAVDFVQADRMRRKVALLMQRVFDQCDLLLVPSLRDEQLIITNYTGHPSLTMRAGFVEVSEARSDWAPDPAHPLPKFSPPRRVPYGITLLARPFDEGGLAETGMILEKAFEVAQIRPEGFGAEPERPESVTGKST
jgi:Asp-tRNA(Asn)/Glu-tRNA(Gln) amidotransferase A subunit family amidase